ncbi:MAG: zf-HC2 domain-containing protein [Actinomycetota bacterium]|nr:zf-HC2 domain-containing protein [Actinomycetota bacterium]
MKCSEIRELLPAYARDQQPTLAVRRHLAGCPDCRADLARYKEMESALEEMRTAVVEVPPDLTAGLFAIPQSQRVASLVRERVSTARTHVSRNRAAYVGGAVAVAGAVGATLWRFRGRRLSAA